MAQLQEQEGQFLSTLVHFEEPGHWKLTVVIIPLTHKLLEMEVALEVVGV